MIFDEKEFRQALEKRDKSVLVDFVCQYKWERDYFQREQEKLAKALDILAFNLVCTIAGLKTPADKRAKKEEYKKLALEVADLMCDMEQGKAEIKEIK